MNRTSVSTSAATSRDMAGASDHQMFTCFCFSSSVKGRIGGANHSPIL